jgi:hypothetical protein
MGWFREWSIGKTVTAFSVAFTGEGISQAVKANSKKTIERFILLPYISRQSSSNAC